jgi:hypothetical protein
MAKIPTQYLINKFYAYSIDPTYRKHDNTYNAGCPVCREGKSLGKKKRLFLYPETNSLYCFNCSKSWSAFTWIVNVCGLSKDEMDSEICSSENFISLDSRLSSMTDKKKKVLPDLPLDSINLFDTSQVEFYKDHKIVKVALNYIKERRLDIAPNRPVAFYISLTDFLHKNRLCVPFYDKKSKIIFYQTRCLDNKNPKYLSKSGYEKTVFNFNKIDIDYPYIFIFEGPFDSMFVKNGVAVGGLTLSKTQNEQLSEYPFHKRIWVLDNPIFDDASKNKTMDLVNSGEKVFKWPSEMAYKDFNEMIMFEDLTEISSEKIINSLY